jgi:hypothetical protein
MLREIWSRSPLVRSIFEQDIGAFEKNVLETFREQGDPDLNLRESARSIQQAVLYRLLAVVAALHEDPDYTDTVSRFLAFFATQIIVSRDARDLNQRIAGSEDFARLLAVLQKRLPGIDLTALRSGFLKAACHAGISEAP